jgi:DNA repair protein RecO (recombination protein O)
VPTEKTSALVIRSVDFSETSRVVTFFTRDFGKVGALAKGGRRIKGPFSGALDLLCVCRIVLIRKHSESLDLVTEAELDKAYCSGPGPQRNSLQVLHAGYYVAELLLELTHDNDPHPALFDAAVETLRSLESGDTVRLVLRRFELSILRETGHAPHLDCCVPCGRTIEGSGSVCFSAPAGGLVCDACAATARGPIRVSLGAVKALRVLGDAANSQWRRLQLVGGPEREVAAVTRGSIQFLVGRELRTARFLRESPT